MALTNDRGNPYINAPDFPGESYEVAGNGSSYAGGLVALNASGYLTKVPGPGMANDTYKVRGVAHERFAAPSATDGEIVARVDRPRIVQGLKVLDTDPVTIADLGSIVYAEDDETIRRTSNTSTRCVAGVLQKINVDGTVDMLLYQP